MRTASERISLLSLDTISPELFGLAPLAIQQHHDEAFDVEAVAKKFFDNFCKTFAVVAKDIRERNGWMNVGRPWSARRRRCSIACCFFILFSARAG